MFPTLLSVPPGASRILRVGTLSAPEAQEATYRLLVTELPKGDGPKGQIAMRLRMSIPVFLTPKGATAEPALSELAVVDGAVQVTLRNTGTAHTRARTVRLTAEAADGTALLDRALPAWYLLAGDSRPYAVPLPAHICAETTRLRVAVETLDAHLQTSAQGPFDCGPQG